MLEIIIAFVIAYSVVASIVCTMGLRDVASGKNKLRKTQIMSITSDWSYHSRSVYRYESDDELAEKIWKAKRQSVLSPIWPIWIIIAWWELKKDVSRGRPSHTKQ